MASYNMNQVRVGLKILVDGDPGIIVDADMVKPGKGQAFTKIKYKNLKTDRVNELTMRSSDSVEGADIVGNRNAVPLQRRFTLVLHGPEHLRAGSCR